MRRTQDLIAKKVGVSQTTVSFALRNNPTISPRTRAKVLKISKKLGYTPLTPITGKTGNIGYIIPTANSSSLTTNPYYHRFFDGVSQEVEDKDYEFFLISLKEDEILPGILRKKKVDGLIVGEKVNKKWVKQVSSILRTPGISALFISLITKSINAYFLLQALVSLRPAISRQAV